ncbi:MAG: YqiA/YcfP family alpha/beta fold hydrolase [Pseudomonadales bacterium]
MRPLIIYIHGFQSSPLSEKAEKVRGYLLDNEVPIDFVSPILPNYPGESYQRLTALVEQRHSRPIALIGSSLGGFMATVLAQQFSLRAVLVNPVIRPYDLMSAFLGENQNPYSGERFFLHEGHMDELRKLAVSALNDPQQLMVLLQTGDEVLDYRQAVSYYQGCRQIVEEGGDHRFQNFDKHLPEVLRFLDLTC